MKLFLGCVLALTLAAQPIKWPASFEKLAKKASDVVDVTVDGSTLKMASKFMSGDGDKDEARMKKAMSQIDGIYIKSFEFDEEGEYSMSDIEEIRKQVNPAEWKRIVHVASKKDGESVEIFVREKDGKNNGFFILAAEPKELTVVQIVGGLSLDELAELSGEMGIPNLGTKKIPFSRKDD